MKSWCTKTLLVLLACVVCLALSGIVLLGYYGTDLPKMDSLSDYNPPQITRMVDRNDRLVAELFDERRTKILLDTIPMHVRNAFLAAEDAEFYQHPGLDFSGMVRALFRNLKAGRVVEGGSTITQQVIKTFLLGPEKSLRRKIKEVLLALRLESNLKKDEILSLYLNQIPFGHRCFGVQEASRFFFGKNIQDVGLDEGALLASLPKSPARYCPIKHPQRALERRNWVLDQMVNNGFINRGEAVCAKSRKLTIASYSVDFNQQAPYYAEHARRMLLDTLGRNRLYRGGLLVKLAMDYDLQQAAQKAVNQGLRRIDRQQGYRGPIGRIDPDELQALLLQKNRFKPDHDGFWTIRKDIHAGTWAARWEMPGKSKWINVPVVAMEVTDGQVFARLDLGSRQIRIGRDQASWARSYAPVKHSPSPVSIADVLAVGDVVEVEIGKTQEGIMEYGLSQPPLVEGSLVAINPTDRHVLALVGGHDFQQSSYIRAIQSRRQPGSAFKPIIFTAAIESGIFTPATIMMDSPEVYYAGPFRGGWKPGNFNQSFVGPVSLRTALSRSINSVAVKVTERLGFRTIISTAKKMGIVSELKPNLTLALGSSEVTLLELTNAYTTLAANGITQDPVFITSVVDAHDVALDVFHSDPPEHSMGAAEAYVMTRMLCSVMEEGTGKNMKPLDRPVAGKSGTTNQQRDGWFVGYTPELSAGVWVGFDDNSPMGTAWAQGAMTSLPIWHEFMEQALKKFPKSNFPTPADVVFVRVNPINGLPAKPRVAGAVFEAFIEGTEPRILGNHLSTYDIHDHLIQTHDTGELPGYRTPEELYH